MADSGWVRHDVGSEAWLAARISVAPLDLPAFSVTRFRVESDRVQCEGPYRLQGELVEGGALPEWLLLLGAMGLHVYGEGDQLIVQDRFGRSAAHDAHRLRMIEEFIAWSVARHAERDGARSADRRSRTELAASVRKHLATGFWPGVPLESGPSTDLREGAQAAEGGNRPARRAARKISPDEFRVYMRTGIHPSGRAERHLPISALVPPVETARVLAWYERPWAQPRTLASQILHALLTVGRSERGREKLDPITELVVLVFMVLALPVTIAGRAMLQGLYLVVLYVEVLFLGAIRRTEDRRRPTARTRVDPRAPFVQLHDALTVEGLDRRWGSVDRERWLARSEEVYDDYLASMETSDVGSRPQR
jgi:hypothetical protein